ncbi:MAG: phosphate ABC transporter ATP-binding protein [Chitinophagaceae bacterium]|nr:phosphate ABC transporter ATP-binding protein [Chitinophagaceae bacterium]
MERPVLTSKKLNAYLGSVHAVKNVNIEISANNILAIMGPSGCGKTTFLRCINRLHELTPGATSNGKILLHDKNIYDMHPVFARLKIGMVFQRPNPFPNLNIFDNVIAGYKLNGLKLNKVNKERIVEDSLTKAALWKEVKDSLHKKGTFLSGGQQQRLCIARAIAMEPEVLLLDEPTSALDPVSTASIEELLHELKKNLTIIVVTHNMQQAARISDRTAFFYMGALIEYDNTKNIFTSPKDTRTQNYITGRFS